VLIQRVDSAEGNGHDVAPAEQREIVVCKPDLSARWAAIERGKGGLGQERRQRRKLHLARGQRVRPYA
tara:strand:- start:761 stop:964 length:204 start_codon:yes stop_codon:yes gene_type:complete